MEPVSVILGGVVVAVVSGTVGKVLGGNGKVKEKTCVERRESYVLLVSEKIDNLAKEIKGLSKTINKTHQ